MKSIIQSKKECFICKKRTCLQDHHIYFGTGKRSISEKNGFKVWLCVDHHTGTFGVHGNKGHETDLYLKKICQLNYEKNHTREEFIKLIGKNYL